MSIAMPKATIFRWVNMAVAWLALSLALMGYFNNLGTTTLPPWSAAEAAILPGLGALGISLGVFDWLHYQSRTTHRHRTKHLLAVATAFVMLFFVQYVGVQLVLASRTAAL
jgi:hypothetical protein